MRQNLREAMNRGTGKIKGKLANGQGFFGDGIEDVRVGTIEGK